VRSVHRSLVWTNNGSFALHTPGQIGFIETLGQPEGLIHFAGEHTSAWTGWMQGALESARRVVLRDQRPNPPKVASVRPREHFGYCPKTCTSAKLR
jgi:hypothetical protein